MINCSESFLFPVDKQLQRRVSVWIIGVAMLVCAGGCKTKSGDDTVSDRHVAKYFLVNLHDNDLSSMDIYAIKEPSEVDRVGHWIREHVNSSENVQKARGLVLLCWHDELLRLDEYGHVISSDYLCDSDVISPTDLAALKTLFQEHGERVNTVPGRKPPKKSDNPKEQALIEKDECNYSPANPKVSAPATAPPSPPANAGPRN